MSIYHDLKAMTSVALHYAKEHKCNYNIILFNPATDGSFQKGSTYEMVADSYFNKERPNVILLHKTDDLIAEEQKAETSPCDIPERTSFKLHDNADYLRLQEYHIPHSDLTFNRSTAYRKQTSRKHKKRFY